MKLILYILLFFVLISSTIATKVPYGVDGYVNNFGEGIIANVSIENLNNGLVLGGVSNIGTVGRYSASISGDAGDLIVIAVNYEGETITKTFSLEGLHHLNFDFETNQSILTKTDTLKIPEIKLLEVKSIGLDKGSKIRTRNSEKISEWSSISDYPNNIIAFVIYEDLEVDIKTDSGKIITKTLSAEGKDYLLKETVTVYDKQFLSVLGIIFFVIITLIIIVGIRK